MAIMRETAYCPNCGKALKERHKDQSNVPPLMRIIGDNFLGYYPCECIKESAATPVKSDVSKEDLDDVEEVVKQIISQKESIEGVGDALISKDAALNELKRFYDYGDENGYSNSELSRIGACIKKISDIPIVSATPSPKETSKEAELINWLNSECPHGTMTADLSHDFAEILREKLDKLFTSQGGEKDKITKHE